MRRQPAFLTHPSSFRTNWSQVLETHFSFRQLIKIYFAIFLQLERKKVQSCNNFFSRKSKLGTRCISGSPVQFNLNSLSLAPTHTPSHALLHPHTHTLFCTHSHAPLPGPFLPQNNVPKPQTLLHFIAKEAKKEENLAFGFKGS